jgi:hypothetical protein
VSPSVPAAAATVAYLTDGQLVAASDRVVHGRVSGTRTERASGGRIYTITTIEVIEDLTGVDRPTVEIRELGGVAGRAAMVVAGAPVFLPGAEILACLERSRDGRHHRLVSLGFSLFAVAPEPGPQAGTLRRQDQSLIVLDRPVREGSSRTLGEFRRVVGAVRGAAPVRFPRGERTPAVEAGPALVAGPEVTAEPAVQRNFTLLGGGTRWNEVDAGASITWFRNLGAPAPVDGSDGTAEILTALSAWTAPQAAAIALVYTGGKDIGGNSPYCDTTNAGSGLISFEDPTDEIAVGVLAIGGGCTTSVGRTAINGVTFDSFTHGFAVFNDTAEVGPTYRSPLNFARLVQHEVGHGIGLGHNAPSAPGAQANIMYASCCYASTPVPPALGPEDLAGIEFIYPMPGGSRCTYSVGPTRFQPGYLATEGAVTVTASQATCAWTGSSGASWVSLVPPTSVTGSGRLVFQVAANRGAERRGTLTVAGQQVEIVQEAYDTDGDGLPDTWERATGLDPLSSAGDAGAAGDPDADGVPNLAELQTGGHPRGFYRTYLAEGVSSAFFHTDTAVAATGPLARGAFYLWYAYQTGQAGAACQAGFEVPADRWFHVPAAGCAASASTPTEVSALLETDVAVAVERTVSWPLAAGAATVPAAPTLDAYGAHAEGDIAQPSSTWFFAEGATHAGFDLFYLVRNIESRPVTVAATYLRPAPLEAVVKQYVVDANTRRTIWVNLEDVRLAATEMAATFVTDGGRVVVERAMYASTPAQVFAAAATAMGATAPASRWMFAEGATGDYFDTFLLLANPGHQPAEVRVSYLLPTGEPLARLYTVAPRARLSIWVDYEDPVLADTAFAADVVSLNGVPIVAERVMWWPGPGAASWQEAHASVGATRAAPRWVTSDGECGGQRRARTYLLVMNPSETAATLTVQLHFSDGVSEPRRFDVPGRTRVNIDVAEHFREADGRRFAATLYVADPATQAVVVERSTYWDGRTQGWAAGVNLRATSVPVAWSPGQE